MRIAIPLFNNRVSPRFDFASRLLLATVEGDAVIQKEELALQGYDLFQRSALLKELSVDTLICGGIQCFISRDLRFSNVEVISPIAGDAEEALEGFLHGTLNPLAAPFPPAPGCRQGRAKKRPRNDKKK